MDEQLMVKRVANGNQTLTAFLSNTWLVESVVLLC